MKTIIAALLFLVPAFGAAESISVGETSIEIPAPTGYVAVTPEMKDLYELQKLFVAPRNEEFISFIPDAIVPSVLRGEAAELPRSFSVQTAKSQLHTSVTTSNFLDLKSAVKSQNDEIFKKVKEQIPGLFEQVNSDITKKYDLNLALSMSQVIPLPVHLETDRSLAFSAFVKYNVNDSSGNAAPLVVVNTTTFIHVNGKVLFLYSFADENDLEWSRETSRQWASAIISANPSNPQVSRKEPLPPAISGIDRSKFGEKAMVGVFVGLIVGLVGWAINKSKSS